MGRKILVVGANSFIALNLIHQLKIENEVTGVYHLNNDKLCNDIRNIPVQKLNELDTEFDVVYILSAFIPGDPNDVNNSVKLFEANVRLVDCICKKFSKSRIVYASSVAVYKPRDAAITENDNEGGLNEYGISKLWGERIVSGNESFAIVRLSSVYGNGMKLTTIIPNYIKQAIESKVITVWGNGERRQDYIHVSDAVNFLNRASLFNGNGIFLATVSQSLSNLQLAEIISQLTGCHISLTGTDKSASFFYDNSYTRSKLQYTAAVPVELGISELIEWIKEKY